MDKEEFIKRLTQLRMNKGVSSQEMSHALGQSHAYINNIENGSGYPTMENFFYICDYLGVSPEEFFATHTPDPIKVKKAYQAISSLSSSQLDAIITIAKEMK